MLDGDDDDRSAISSLILPVSGQNSPREDLVNTKLIKFDVSFVYFTMFIHGLYIILQRNDNSYKYIAHAQLSASTVAISFFFYVCA